MLYFGICVEFYKDNYIYVIFYGKIYMILYKAGYCYIDTLKIKDFKNI